MGAHNIGHTTGHTTSLNYETHFIKVRTVFYRLF